MIKSAVSIVVGLGFGDEGKGLATDSLCLKANRPLVIRFNGGQQAGHTVVTGDGKRHVFSNFGAGSLRNAPTYWSQYCTFSPGSMLNEWEALQNIGITPQLYVDNLCPVTTHYDSLFNKLLEDSRGSHRHGSCGLGFGVTVERHSLSPFKFFAQDLQFPAIVRHRLKKCRQYYQQKASVLPGIDFNQFDHDGEDARFLQMVEQIVKLKEQNILHFIAEKEVFLGQNPWNDYIFEGAQGILLDQDFGFFPHVTRSNTTSKNALALINQHLASKISQLDIFYITRIYQTRHGEGPMTNETIELSLKNNEYETNVFNNYQGNFRVSPLDIDLINYSLTSDNNYSTGIQKKLVVTCMDQVDNQLIPYRKNNTLLFGSPESAVRSIDFSFNNPIFSYSNCAENI